MMIYLIDDNQNNQRASRYGIHFVDDGTFHEYLTSIEQIEKREKADDISHLEFLKIAKCILLHTSTEDWSQASGFLKGSTTNAEKIKADIADFGDKIPLVLFSNSMGSPVYSYKDSPNYMKEIKKNLFYENLYEFLEHYKNNNVIDFRILAYGKNFHTQDVKQLSLSLLDSVSSRNGNEDFVITDISGKLQDFRCFIELSFPDKKWTVFLENLEDNPITISDFRKKINQITESFLKYGKNIYTWQW